MLTACMNHVPIFTRRSSASLLADPGGRPPKGPDSFVSTYKFFEMQPRRVSAPPYEVGALMGNPGSATDLSVSFSIFICVSVFQSSIFWRFGRKRVLLKVLLLPVLRKIWAFLKKLVVLVLFYVTSRLFLYKFNCLQIIYFLKSEPENSSFGFGCILLKQWNTLEGPNPHTYFVLFNCFKT